MSIFNSALHILVGRVVSILISFIGGIILARFLGPSDRGVWAIYLYTLTLVSLFVNAGIAEASIYMLNKEDGSKTNTVSSLITHQILVCAILGLATFFCYRFFEVDLLDFFLLALCTVMVIFNSLFRHFLLAEKDIKKYNLSVVLENVCFVLLLLFFCFKGLTILNVILSYLVSIGVATTYLLVQIKTKFKIRLFQKKDYSIIKKGYSFGFSLFFTGLGGFGLQRINFYVLDFFSGSKMVGLFTVASAIPAIYENIPQQMSTIAYTYTSGEMEDDYRKKIATGIVKGVFYCMIVGILPIAIFPEAIVKLIFGEAFAGIGFTMIVLCVSAILLGISGILFNMLAGIGKSGYGTSLTIINLSITLVSSILMVQYFGIEGAAYARLLAAFVSLTFIGYYFSRHYKISVGEMLIIKKEEILWLRNSIKSLTFKRYNGE